MKPSTLAVMLLIGALLNGCVTTYRAGDKKVAVFDIKKRIVTSAMVGTKKVVTCSEPSPDALSALALQLGIQTPAGVGGQAGLQENAAYVGMRTESIQMLRDLGYRTCEAYQNEAIDTFTYGLMMRRYEKLTALLVALERLGSTATTQEVSLTPQAVLPPVSATATAAKNLLNGALGNVDELIRTATPDTKNNLVSLKNELGQIQGQIARLSPIDSKGKPAAKTAIGAAGPAQGLSGSDKKTPSGHMSSDIASADSLRSNIAASVALTLRDVVTADDLGEECVGLIKETHDDMNANPRKVDELRTICLSYFRVQLLARAEAVTCTSDEAYQLVAPVLGLSPSTDIKGQPTKLPQWTSQSCRKKRGGSLVKFDSPNPHDIPDMGTTYVKKPTLPPTTTYAVP